MNNSARVSIRILINAITLLCLLSVGSVYGQTTDNLNNNSVQSNCNVVQTQNQSYDFDNHINATKTRRFSCSLAKHPGVQYDAKYSINSGVSELGRMHVPAVLGADGYIFASDTFSLYQFELSNNSTQGAISPKYASNNIILGVTEQFVIQKHRIDKQSCVTSAPLSNLSSESSVYCSDTYYKAQYFNDAVYILSDIPCKRDNSRKACHDKSVSLERYTLSANRLWSVELDKMPSSSIVGMWGNTILILNSNSVITAIDSDTGSVIYDKNYSSELDLDKDYYQFNHFYVDKSSGLFVVASRYHNKITVIDIKTGEIVKSHDFGKAYEHNKFLDEDYHYIELGDFAFPLNTIMGIDNGIMFLRKEKNVLAAVELKTGNVLWKYDIYNSPLNVDPAQNRDDIAYQVGDILITDDLVIVGYNKFATALNKTSGSVVWNYSFFPFNGYFGYQMWLSCIGSHLMIQSDNIYLYSL